MVDPLPLWAPAHSYLVAAKILSGEGDHEDARPLSAPIYLLVGFTIELILKAFLAKHGASQNELRAVGHDLARSLRECKAKGLIVEGDIEQAIVMISEPHRTHAFRYLDTIEYELPLIDPLIPILEKWDKEMHVEIFER